jgi:Predicted membrane protein
MASPPTIDWNAVIADPRFQTLHRKKQGFLTGLMIFSVAFYFLLPIGAAYFQDLFKTRVWGVINFGLLFALSEFVVAWLVAFYYSRRAGGEFDSLAREIAADYERGKVRA